MYVFITGGGTGGHIYTALAIAEEIQQKLSCKIHFIGAIGKIEMTEIPKSGYTISGLWVSGWKKNLISNLLLPIKLLVSCIKAQYLIIKYRPKLVIGTGGYASVPMMYVASLNSIPSCIHEQNALPGKANLFLAKRVNKIGVAYPNMEKYFPNKKIIYIGNPIRNILDKNRLGKKEAYEHFGLDLSKKTILITGGSLGAKSINEAFVKNISILMKVDVQYILQTGSVYFPKIKRVLSKIDNAGAIKVYDFIVSIHLAYEIADIVVCRAGALTLSELALLGKAVICIPSPNVANNHQVYNIMSLVEKKAAIMIEDSELDQKLGETILLLLKDEKKRKELSRSIKHFAEPNAGANLVHEVMKLIK